MTVVMITYCECKKINSVLLNKTNIKADSITYADMISFIAKKQTSANILEYMINQFLF